MNRKCWNVPLGGIKSCLVKVCFEVPPERVECTGWTEWVGMRVPNSCSSCVETAGTENKVIAGDLYEVRGRWPKNMRRTLRNKMMSEVRWSTSVHHLKGKRGKLEIDVPMNWEPVEFAECVDRRQMWWFLCNNTLAEAFWALSKRAIFSDGEPYKTELTWLSWLEIKAEAMAVAVERPNTPCMWC